MSADQPIMIRDCISLEDFRACVALQKSVWGWDDEDLIPTRFFVVAHKIEGQVIGAFDSAGQLVGFCLAVPALRGSQIYLHSHMLAVLPEHRRAGLGRRMKLEQRRQALEKGIRLVEWTFDPLEWKNAIFNLNQLGAIARRYVPNAYGISSSPLHRGLPTDRLIAEWWLDSPRVLARVEGTEAGRETPSAGAPERVALPLSVLDQSSGSGKSAADVQASLRAQFEKAFSRGLAAAGFEIGEVNGVYLLSSDT